MVESEALYSNYGQREHRSPELGTKVLHPLFTTVLANCSPGRWEILDSCPEPWPHTAPQTSNYKHRIRHLPSEMGFHWPIRSILKASERILGLVPSGESRL